VKLCVVTLCAVLARLDTLCYLCLQPFAVGGRVVLSVVQHPKHNSLYPVGGCPILVLGATCRCANCLLVRCMNNACAPQLSSHALPHCSFLQQDRLVRLPQGVLPAPARVRAPRLHPHRQGECECVGCFGVRVGVWVV
jgi:hypothetical protein